MKRKRPTLPTKSTKAGLRSQAKRQVKKSPKKQVKKSPKKQVKKPSKKQVKKSVKKPVKKLTKKQLVQRRQARKLLLQKRRTDLLLKRQEVARKAAATRLRHKKERMRILRDAYEQDRKRRRDAREFIRYIEKKPAPKTIPEQPVFDGVADLETPQSIIDKTIQNIERFAERQNFEVETSGAILSDLSAVIEARFYDIEDRVDDLLMYLGAEIQHWGGPFKVTIVPVFNATAEAHATEMKGSTGKFDKYWDTFNNLPAIPTNVSGNIPRLFRDFRSHILPILEHWTGVPPDYIMVRLFAGETIMGTNIPRKSALKPYFKK